MAILPTSGQAIKLPASIDWVALSKTVCIEIAFLVSVGVPILGHVSPDVLGYCQAVAVATGGALGVLRLSDILANVVNVRAFLGSPGALAQGVVPQAVNTPLYSTPTSAVSPVNGGGNGGGNGSATGTGAAATPEASGDSAI